MSEPRDDALCAVPECEEPPAFEGPDWCNWHSDLLYEHRQPVDAPHPGNDKLHARQKQDCPACSLGVDPRKGHCLAPACGDRVSVDAADEGELAAWCRLHGDLLLAHWMDELEQTDNHLDPRDREQCPACNRWVQS